MQFQSDPFLGWTTIEGRDYLVRQLNDHKASVPLEELKAAGLLEYAAVCGETLARGHARAGDPCRIAGYIGTSDRFDSAIAKFAAEYAEQTERDWETLVRSRKVGPRVASKSRSSTPSRQTGTVPSLPCGSVKPQTGRALPQGRLRRDATPDPKAERSTGRRNRKVTRAAFVEARHARAGPIPFHVSARILMTSRHARCAPQKQSPPASLQAAAGLVALDAVESYQIMRPESCMSRGLLATLLISPYVEPLTPPFGELKTT